MKNRQARSKQTSKMQNCDAKMQNSKKMSNGNEKMMNDNAKMCRMKDMDEL